MDVQSIIRMILVFAALGAVLFYGSRFAGNIARKV